MPDAMRDQRAYGWKSGALREKRYRPVGSDCCGAAAGAHLPRMQGAGSGSLLYPCGRRVLQGLLSAVGALDLMRRLLILIALAGAGCSKASAPAVPPVPALASVTFQWNEIPDPCRGASGCSWSLDFVCQGSPAVYLQASAMSYTANLPIGPATCALQDTVSLNGENWQLETSWTGTISAGPQTITLIETF